MRNLYLPLKPEECLCAPQIVIRAQHLEKDGLHAFKTVRGPHEYRFTGKEHYTTSRDWIPVFYCIYCLEHVGIYNVA